MSRNDLADAGDTVNYQSIDTDTTEDNGEWIDVRAYSRMSAYSIRSVGSANAATVSIVGKLNDRIFALSTAGLNPGNGGLMTGLPGNNSYIIPLAYDYIRVTNQPQGPGQTDVVIRLML